MFLAGYVCFLPQSSRMLSKSTDAVQVNNIFLSKVECPSYELCKILCSVPLSPLYLNLLKSFIYHKVRRFFQEVAASKLPKIYLYNPVGMKLYWHHSAMYVMVVIAWQGKLADYCLDCPLHSHVGKVVERLRRTISRNEKVTCLISSFVSVSGFRCFCRYVIIDFPLIFSMYIRLLAFLFNYPCYCTGYERASTYDSGLAFLCSNPAWDMLNSIFSGFPQFLLPVNFVS
jgi:hypothetical protein